MARHRSVRSMKYEDEFDDYSSDDNGISLENGCITPETENMYTYTRERLQSMSKIWEPHNPPVEEEDESEPAAFEENEIVDTGPVPEADQPRFFDCLDKMRSVVGDSISEKVLHEAAKSQNFDPEKALNVVLSMASSGTTSEKLPTKNNAKADGAGQGLRKPAPSEAKASKPVQTPVVSIPPAEVPTRMTFSGKVGKESSSKVVTLQAASDGIQSKPKELKVDKDANPSLRKLSPDLPKVTTSPKPTRVSKVDPTVIQKQYEQERTTAKPLLNLVVVGHVDAGKSTLIGHLLFLTGNVNKRTMDKYEHESKKLGKASFAYAWVLDETSEERSRGITMDVAQARLETEHRTVTILDTPGHKEFIPNMITGAAQADVAILVVNATRGEFETGFESGGQTREHTMLIRSLGVSQLAVAVNKLDTSDWAQSRFNEIVCALKPFLKQTGFSEQNVWYVPCSGLAGENLCKRSEVEALKAWYKGPSLVEVIDAMKSPSRAVTKPLRMCVTDIFKGVQSVGTWVSGKIESGSLAQGDRLMMMPAQESCVVKSVAIDDMSQPRAYAGDNITVCLDKCDPTNIVPGSVLCDPAEPIRVVTKFEAKVVIFNVEMPIIKGFSVILHYQAMSEQAHFKKLVKELNRVTGEVIREKPRCLPKNSSGVVIIKVARPICLELYQDSKELGRITIRQAGHTIAAGIVTALL